MPELARPGATGDFLMAFGAVLIALPALIHYAAKLGLVDRPDERKVHHGEVPLVGGIALYLGLLLALGFRHLAEWPLAMFLAGGFLLVLVGSWDDRHQLTTRVRFLVQIAAACLMIFMAGVELADFGRLLSSQTLGLGWLAVPVTLFCVVGVTNATNMIDGMDGLCASLALVTLAGLAAAHQLRGVPLAAAPLLVALAGGLCAWLLYNLRLPWRRRAMAFLGDAGTLLLGFALAWLLVASSQGPGRVIAPVTALWLFAVPLLDTVFVMIKRRQAGVSMVEADQEHLHHAFLRSGWGVNATLAMVVATAAVLAAVGLLLERSGVAENMRFLAFLSLAAAYYLAMNRAWRTHRFLGRPIE